MTYKAVLRSLLDVFPQIDLRILKSVAIEYARDADAAVEFILSDVLPVISQPVTSSFTPDVFHDTEDTFDEGSTAKGRIAVTSFKNENVSVESTHFDEPLLSVKENEKVSTDCKSQVPDNLIPVDHNAVSGILENRISQAESGKEMLAYQYESVVKKLEEIELHEDLAKKAEEEVSFAGQDMMKKVEDLREIARNAEKANNEKAREVNDEKLMLETKAREIHDELLYITDKREECLSMIAEIGLILEARLTAAKARETEAFRLKFEKEEMARRAVDEQEAVVKWLLQESRRLEEEAEENAKLKGCLEFSGHMVDSLKREIDSFWENATSLKGRVNGCAQLEKSLVPLGASSLASSTNAFLENLSYKSSIQAVVSTSSVGIVQDPQNHDPQDSGDSTNVIQSPKNQFATSSLSNSTGPDDYTAFAKSDSHSLVDDCQSAKKYLDQNVQWRAGGANALDSEKLILSPGFGNLVTGETERVISPITIVKEPRDNNLQSKGGVDSQPNSDDDWEICDGEFQV